MKENKKERERDKENKKEKEQKKDEKETKKIGGVKEELMSDPGKEKKIPKVTCDECRSRISFELNVAAAIEEKVFYRTKEEIK